jgi:hypothetical protein
MLWNCLTLVDKIEKFKSQKVLCCQVRAYLFLGVAPKAPYLLLLGSYHEERKGSLLQ